MVTHLKFNPVALLILASTLLVISCGDSSNPHAEGKSKIDELTHEIATDAVQGIKSPINKAKAATAAENFHNQKIKESAELE